MHDEVPFVYGRPRNDIYEFKADVGYENFFCPLDIYYGTCKFKSALDSINCCKISLLFVRAAIYTAENPSRVTSFGSEARN